METNDLQKEIDKLIDKVYKDIGLLGENDD